MRIFKTKWFDGFACKNDIHDAALIEAVKRAEKGLIDADLDGGVIKQRVAREAKASRKDIASSSFSARATRRLSFLAFQKMIKATCPETKKRDSKKWQNNIFPYPKLVCLTT